MKILIGICGSIAAYKVLDLIRILKKNGAEVRVLLTASAQNFVTPLSCQTLTEHEVYMEQFALTRGIKHIALSQWADALVVAPATANMIGKAASGIADDLLSTTILSFQKPILFVPAMDTGMWQNAIVQKNTSILTQTGIKFLEPASGALASGKVGKGRFPHPQLIYRAVVASIEKRSSLKGRKILISGGRTEEDIDPVRVVTNRSSGKMVVELMYAAACRDAQVRVIMGEASVPLPDDMDIVRVRTSSEMLRELESAFPWCNCMIMAAAVGDYQPIDINPEKVHVDEFAVQFRKTPDILKALSNNKGDRFIVGFSLEDNDPQKRGMEKVRAKGLDMVVLNSSQALGSDETRVALLFKDGRYIETETMNKWCIANTVLDQLVSKSNN